MMNFQIIYHEDEDKIVIFKPNTRQDVERLQGKYGIEMCRDIKGSVFGMSIPESSILFGFNPDLLKNFINS